MDRHELLFRAEVSSRYHRSRGAFLDLVSTLANFALILGSGGGFLAVVSDNPEQAKWITLGLTVVATAQMVFKLDASSANHRFWLARWNRMLSQINQAPNPTARQLAEWTNELYAIQSECVGEMKTLAHLCYNQAKAALGLTHEEDFPIPFFRRLTCQIVS